MLYVLSAAGTIDEKIYQRQRSKGDIAATMAMGGGGGGGKAGGGKGQVGRGGGEEGGAVQHTSCACSSMVGIMVTRQIVS